MVDIKNIPTQLKNTCKFCVWKFEKRSGQKTKMPYNPANGDRAKINDLRTFADFKATLMAYAMGGYDGIGIAVSNGIGAFDIDHCIREDGTLNDMFLRSYRLLKIAVTVFKIYCLKKASMPLKIYKCTRMA